MKREQTDTVQEHFRHVVPMKFVEHMMRRQEGVYKEAESHCFKSTLWTRAEGEFLCGDIERSIFENEMRKAAIASGLRWENTNHNGNNCTCVRVFAGQFRITGHRVPTPGCFVPDAESRKQAAAANEFMNGYLEGSLCIPLPRLEEAKEIVAYILHGKTQDETGKLIKPFLELAIPDAESARYVYRASLADIKQAYLADSRKLGPTHAIEDLAKPKPKIAVAQGRE